ncbi:indoleamine 2,3-dioxygenase 2-like [Amphiura filiformis]|uniref:indoleamine 2,3-dioxygenase 2-like n=1 Tax=Amphiura filiformis TaxID=82378 RepID=UPI003B2146A6
MANKVTSDKAVPCLEEYHVSAKYAFLLQDPLTKLPEYYQPWMTIAENLEQSISNGTIREQIQAMPLLDYSRLSGHKQYRLAQLILCCLTQGYVWVDGEDGIPEILPKQLAVPFAGVSEHLHVQPIICVTNFGLCNWKLKDPSQPAELEY